MLPFYWICAIKRGGSLFPHHNTSNMWCANQWYSCSQPTYERETPVMTQSRGWSVHFPDKKRSIRRYFWKQAKTKSSGRVTNLISVTQWANRSIFFFPSKQNNFAGGGTTIVTWCVACLPGHDDEEVQAVPGVSQVTAAAKDPKSHHLYDHLQSEEDVDEGIKGLQGDAEWQQAVRKDAEETIRLGTFHSNSWRKLILLLRIK